MASKNSADSSSSSADPIKTKEVYGGFASDETDPLYKICLNVTTKAIKSNPKVFRLLEAMEEMGCELPPSFIQCRKCEGPMTGGFIINSQDSKGNYTPQVIVCQDKIKDSWTFNSTLAHELVHAYDACRSKLNISNCVQHACAEIRASSLSGECSITEEFFRGNRQIQFGLRDCVKRRATLSLQANPSCANVADKAVGLAFDRCFNDYLPFTRDDVRHDG